MKKGLSCLLSLTICLLFSLSGTGAFAGTTAQADDVPQVSLEIGDYRSDGTHGFLSADTVRSGRAKTSAAAGETIVVSFLLHGMQTLAYYQLSGVYDDSLLAPGYYADGVWTDGDAEKEYNTVVDGSYRFTAGQFQDALSFTRATLSPTIYLCGYSRSGSVPLSQQTQTPGGVTVDGTVLASVGFTVLADIENIYTAFTWDTGTSVSPALSQEYVYPDTLSVACRHAYAQTVYAPSCTAQGYTVYACTTCPSMYTGDYLPATGHYYLVDGAPVNGWFSYTCTCGKTTQKTYRDLSMLWRTKHINTVPNSTAYDTTCLLDVVPDGVLNAKDYAVILQSKT